MKAYTLENVVGLLRLCWSQILFCYRSGLLWTNKATRLKTFSLAKDSLKKTTAKQATTVLFFFKSTCFPKGINRASKGGEQKDHILLEGAWGIEGEVPR